MLKHVLVPLDGSKLAHAALDHALNIVGEGGKITLLTVLQPPEIPLYDFYPVPVAPQTKDYEASFADTISRAKDYLKRTTNDIQERHTLDIDNEVEAGDPATVIVALAKNRNVDAIVMSTHGRSGISRWLFGSVTHKVLSISPIPVYVIPASACEDHVGAAEDVQNQLHPV